MDFSTWLSQNYGLAIVLIGVIGIVASIIGGFIARRSARKNKSK